MKTTVLIAVLSAVALFGPAATRAATPCGDAVLRDWKDGRVDDDYAPRCYEDALDSLPEDVRAYTTASDDISRAMHARLRELRSRPVGARTGRAADEPASTLPIPLVSGAALAAVLALAVQTDVIGVPWLAYVVWALAGSALTAPRPAR